MAKIYADTSEKELKNLGCPADVIERVKGDFNLLTEIPKEGIEVTDFNLLENILMELAYDRMERKYYGC